MPGIESAREHFPALAECVYLNTATLGIMAAPVAAGYLPLLERFELMGLVASPEAREWAETARRRLAAVTGAQPDEIALTGNATDGLAYLAAALRWGPRDEVLLSDQEHPAMVFPFTYVAAQGQGAALRRFPVHADPQETLAAFRRALVPGRTRLVAFSHLTSQTGTRLPAAEMIREAQAAGALCFLDATQSFAQLPPAEVDLGALGADFATSNGHKWLGAGKGTGFFYVRRDRLDLLTPAHVGAGALRWPAALGDAPAGGDPARLDPVEGARRFEYGTRNWMLYASVPLALDWMEDLGWEAVAGQSRELAAALRDALREVPGIRLLSPETWAHGGAMTSFAVPGVDVLDLAQRLWEAARIRVRTVPEMGALRVSTAYYNSVGDVETFVAALAGALKS